MAAEGKGSWLWPKQEVGVPFIVGWFHRALSRQSPGTRGALLSGSLSPVHMRCNSTLREYPGKPERNKRHTEHSQDAGKESSEVQTWLETDPQRLRNWDSWRWDFMGKMGGTAFVASEWKLLVPLSGLQSASPKSSMWSFPYRKSRHRYGCFTFTLWLLASHLKVLVPCFFFFFPLLMETS